MTVLVENGHDISGPTANRTAITNAEDGQVFFDTTLQQFFVWTTSGGGSWLAINTGGIVSGKEVLGVAAGYKLARGVTAITGASQDIVTGLATVVDAVAIPTTDPTLTDMWKACTVGNQTGAPAAGSIRVTSTKPTANNDVTPIAATTPWRSVAWIAIGT